MGWEQIFIYVIILAIILGLIGTFLRMAGLDVADIIRAIAGARRKKLDVEPRDHFERWIEGHKRSARDNKPKEMKWLWVTGDSEYPRKRIGKIVGLEKHKHFNIYYVKSRILSWSFCVVVPEDLVSDANRKNIWIKARGLSNDTIIRIPIATEEIKDINSFNKKVVNDFRYMFEMQSWMDIFENMAWGIDQGMQPPVKTMNMPMEAIQPKVVEKEYMPEDKTAGGNQT